MVNSIHSLPASHKKILSQDHSVSAVIKPMFNTKPCSAGRPLIMVKNTSGSTYLPGGLKKASDVYDKVEEEAKVFVPKSSKLNIYRFYPSPCANFHLLVTKEENFCNEGGGEGVERHSKIILIIVSLKSN